MSIDSSVWCNNNLYPGGDFFMTAIIGFVHNDIAYIAGERGNSDEDIIVPSLCPKVFNIGPYAYGYAGSSGVGQMIAYTFNFPRPANNIDIHKFLLGVFIPALRKHLKDAHIDTDKEEDATDILLGYKGRIFEISTYDFQCVEYSITAIGSGNQITLGAYHVLESHNDPLYIARTCIEAANRFSTTCGGTIDIIYS